MVDSLYYLNAGGKKGTFNSSDPYPSTPASVNALFDYLRSTQAQKLTLHFHGGLVSTEDGAKIAEVMKKNYEGVSHPVSFIWETGVMKTILHRFEEVDQTEIFILLKKIVIRKAAEHLGGESGTKGVTPVTAATIETEIKKETPFQAYDDLLENNAKQYSESDISDLENLIASELEIDFAMGHPLPEVIERDGPSDPYINQNLVPPAGINDDARAWISPKMIFHITKVTMRVILRFREGADHGFYPTVIEEICREFYIGQLGKLIWDEIKDKARAMWADNTGLQDSELHAGRYFLDQLSKHKTLNPEFTVDLVGHSAGSIVICHLLDVVDKHYPHLLPMRNILLLAPACRTDLFTASLLEKPNRFREIRVFTMDEKTEQEDKCVPIIYTRSLLYLISGLLEEESGAAILGLASQLKRKKPYDSPSQVSVAQYLKDKTIYSPSPTGAKDGAASTAKKHGDFDNDCPTLKSLKFIISQ